MPQNDRDHSLIEHLATKVMGWEKHPFGNWRIPATGEMRTLNINSWADAGMVWEKAVQTGGWISLELGAYAIANGATLNPIRLPRNQGPRAICEAVYRATGGEE